MYKYFMNYTVVFVNGASYQADYIIELDKKIVDVDTLNIAKSAIIDVEPEINPVVHESGVDIYGIIVHNFIELKPETGRVLTLSKQ